MKFKIDNNLERVASEKTSPVAIETFAVELCGELMKACNLVEGRDDYGETFMVVFGECFVLDTLKVLSKYLYGDETHPVPADVFDALCKTVLMGEYNCPKCGGKLIYDCTKGHELQDGDHYTPNSYVIDFYLYHCPICGETIKSKNEL